MICLALSLALVGSLRAEIDMNIIAQIESNCNPYAFNKSSGAIGLLQITKPVVDEFNQRYSKKELYYEMEELYQIDVNWKIGSWYMNTRIPQMLKHYKIEDTIDNRLWAYNAGIGNVVKGRKVLETINYIKKYHKLERGKR